MFTVWPEMTLSMHLSAGEWLICESKLIILSCRSCRFFVVDVEVFHAGIH